MARPFLDERVSDRIRFGSTYDDQYSVELTQTAGGSEHARLIHPFPRRVFTVSYVERVEDAWSELLSLYHRAYGRFAGFRMRCVDDYSTAGAAGSASASDSPMTLVADGVYQITKSYGTNKAGIALGYPVRPILKPVSGSALVSIAGVTIEAANYTVDYTAGQVTFDADNTRSITGISQAAQAVVTVGAGHGFGTEQSVHVSGVAGMTQINGLRADVVSTTSTTITIDLNTSPFNAYTSGGVAHTRPQLGEVVAGGCEFDFPVRFDSTMPVGHDWSKYRSIESIRLIELLNL